MSNVYFVDSTNIMSPQQFEDRQAFYQRKMELGAKSGIYPDGHPQHKMGPGVVTKADPLPAKAAGDTDDESRCGTCGEPLTPRGRQVWEPRGGKYVSCGCAPAQPPVVAKSDAADATDSTPAKRQPWELRR